MLTTKRYRKGGTRVIHVWAKPGRPCSLEQKGARGWRGKGGKGESEDCDKWAEAAAATARGNEVSS